MTCSRPHVIELSNLWNDERVNHSILLIDGNVRQRCAHQQHIQLESSWPDTGAVHQHWETEISHSGRFKFLLDLRDLEKRRIDEVTTVTLDFAYCSARHKQRFQYASLASSYRIQPLYILCHDEATNGIAEACELIDLNLRLVQSVYAEKIRATGFGRRTYALNAACSVHHSKLLRDEAWKRNEHELWDFFAQELLNSPLYSGSAAQSLKFVAFIGCTRYDGTAVVSTGDFSYASIRQHLYAHAALGGGGLALFGSAYFYAWPRRFNEILTCFRNNTKVDLAKVPDDSNYRRTHGGVYATTLGSIAHELGHIFDLGHTADGVMGKGFDFINRVFVVEPTTEHLPERLINRPLSSAALEVGRPRFTQLKRQSNHFLANYHEQKQEHDGFYFSRNCAIILYQHKWLRSNSAPAAPVVEVYIDFDRTSRLISSKGVPLSLVELRENSNSFVTAYYELSNAEQCDVYSFQLPAEAAAHYEQQTHHIFVFSTSGEMKRFD